MRSEPLSVEIWSDVVCPWCCIGRAQLELALAEFEHADDVALTWRSFELDPAAPATSSESLTEQLGRKFSVGPAQVASMFEDVTERAASVGLDFRFDLAQPGNTFDAHRLLHLALDHGQQDVLKGRLFRAYFTEGAEIGDHGTLTRLAVDAGLDEADVTEVLASDRYADRVRADEAEARALQVSGVPFFVVGRRYGVAGAQPAEHLLAVLRQAWAERQAA